jgi:hypothetical protein
MSQAPISETPPAGEPPRRLTTPHRIAWHSVGTEPPREKVIVRNLDFHYNKVQALFDINATFYDNCVTALIGP